MYVSNMKFNFAKIGKKREIGELFLDKQSILRIVENFSKGFYYKHCVRKARGNRFEYSFYFATSDQRVICVNANIRAIFEAFERCPQTLDDLVEYVNYFLAVAYRRNQENAVNAYLTFDSPIENTLLELMFHRFKSQA